MSIISRPTDTGRGRSQAELLLFRLATDLLRLPFEGRTRRLHIRASNSSVSSTNGATSSRARPNARPSATKSPTFSEPPPNGALFRQRVDEYRASRPNPGRDCAASGTPTVLHRDLHTAGSPLY